MKKDNWDFSFRRICTSIFISLFRLLTIMEDKLVTLAILTYAKAQILKNVLENEGIETCIHNINQIQPVVSSGVRVRIKESDLPRALKITESSAWLSEEVVEGKSPHIEKSTNKILIPVDFSNYSLKACEFGFHFAQNAGAEVLLLHVFFTPIYATSLPYSDIFNLHGDEENTRNILQKAHNEVTAFSDKIKEKINSGYLPDIKYSCILREGIPEEEIIRYAKEIHPRMIIMGTRGKDQKDIDLIGSVTAEVIERAHTTVLAIPERTLIEQLSEVKRIAFITNFDQRDLIAFDSLIHNSLKDFKFAVSLIHLAEVKDTWNEIKLGGIKEYFQKQYPNLEIYYDVVQDDNFLINLDHYIKSKHIDIITLTSYKRNIFSRLFNPSIARKMIFHSDTPLMVVYSKPN